MVERNPSTAEASLVEVKGGRKEFLPPHFILIKEEPDEILYRYRKPR
jgi:hypothetical protein